MRRAKYNPSTYEISTDRARYAVVLKHRKNTESGCPRFTATVICLEVFGEKHYTGFFYTTEWNFKGSYISEAEEAEKAVRAYENGLKENGIY